MGRVLLVPTGMLEWEGLPPALGTLFPGNEFVSVPTKEERFSKPDLEFPISSLCSSDIEKVSGRKNNADKLIERAALEAMSDARRGRADLVLILDDLELENDSKAALVTAEMRLAVERHLARPELAKDLVLQGRTREALKAKVSFHLARPMIESWILADPSGPTRAGVPPARPALLAHGRDPEEFQADDATYVAATDDPCTCWKAMPTHTGSLAKKKSKATPAWVRAGSDRIRHPKAYLSWLCLDPAAPKCTHYRETQGGKDALKALDWPAVVAGHPTGLPFLRAMIADIADGLRQDPITGPAVGPEAPETSRFKLPPDPLLRNL